MNKSSDLVLHSYIEEQPKSCSNVYSDSNEGHNFSKGNWVLVKTYKQSKI